MVRRAVGVMGALLLMGAGASAADLQISPGRVDPPDYPAASTNWTWQRVVRTWGPPTSCEFNDPCTGNASDIVFYPFRVVVLKQVRIKYIEVSSTAWSTPQGIRRMSSLARLEATYGTRLIPVQNRHQAVGKGDGPYRIDELNYMVVAGSNALGFSMASGKVSTILTGKVGEVRRTLEMYGPL